MFIVCPDLAPTNPMLQVGNFKCSLSFVDPSRLTALQVELEQYLECVHEEYNRATCWIASEEFCVKLGSHANLPVQVQVSPVFDGVPSDFDVYIFLHGKPLQPTEEKCVRPTVLKSPTSPTTTPSFVAHGKSLSPLDDFPTSPALTQSFADEATLIQLTGDTLTNRPLYFAPGFFPSLQNHACRRRRISTSPARPRDCPSPEKVWVPSGILEVVVTAYGSPPVLPNFKPGKRHNLAAFTFCYTSSGRLTPSPTNSNYLTNMLFSKLNSVENQLLVLGSGWFEWDPQPR